MIPDGAVIVGISATLIGSMLAVLLSRALDNRRMRSPNFRNLDAERQRKNLAEYLGVVPDQHIAGRIAIEAIEKYSRRSRLGLAEQRLEAERRPMAERASLATTTAR